MGYDCVMQLGQYDINLKLADESIPETPAITKWLKECTKIIVEYMRDIKDDEIKGE